MMFLFKSTEKNLYSSPDAYIVSHKNNIIEWGAILNMYPVFYKGSSVLYGRQKIYANFTHDGSVGNLGTINWLNYRPRSDSWYSMDNIKLINVEKVVIFDLGKKHPKYFLSKEDLLWYIGNIYNVENIYVNDESV